MNETLSEKLQEKFYSIGPAGWVTNMINFYNENGFYRAEDLRRLLGNPTRGVEISEKGSREALLQTSS